MTAYTQPIYVAAIFFILLAFMLFFPWLIYTYRKYNHLPISVTIITFSFIFYFLSALFLVLLPLPEVRDTCSIQKPDTQHFSLIPFQFVVNTFDKSGIVFSQPSTYIQLFKQPSFFQALFNFLLLLPFGVYLRYFFQEKRHWKKAMGFTFLLTLFYEITQVTGIYGIYNCAYRIFDVDDLLLNTGGGLLGFFLAPAVLALFPSRRKVNEKADELLAHDKVKPMSVLLAFIIDLFFTKIISSIIISFSYKNEVSVFVVNTVVLLVLFFAVPLFWRGNTFGTKIMRFRYESRSSKAEKNKRLFKRFVGIYALYFITGVARILNSIAVPIDAPYYKASVFLSFGAWVIYIILTTVLLLHILLVLFSKGKRRFYFDEASDLYTTRNN